MASSLTIAPALGHSPVAGQGQPGGYDAIDFRAFWGAPLQEGALDAGAFEVTQKAAGANLSVDVACSTGHVFVQGDSVTNQGLYVVRPHTAVANLDIATAHATLPRVDSVVVQVEDDEHDSSGNTRAQVKVLTGTATSGATLDNRTGAPSLPSSAMLLADVHVPATDTTIANSQIRDRRKWARGAFWTATRTAGNYTTSSGTYADIDGTNLKPRIECSGVPLRVMLHGSGEQSVSGARIDIRPAIDGSAVGSITDFFTAQENSAAGDIPVAAVYTFTPSAGSHQLSWQWKTIASGTATLFASTTQPLIMTIEEIVRQNTANNTTTSG